MYVTKLIFSYTNSTELAHILLALIARYNKKLRERDIFQQNNSYLLQFCIKKDKHLPCIYSDI